MNTHTLFMRTIACAICFFLLFTGIGQSAQYNQLDIRSINQIPRYSSLANATTAGSKPGNFILVYTGADSGFYGRSFDNTRWIKLPINTPGVTVSSYGKNAGRDSTVLVLSNGARYAAKDSVGASFNFANANLTATGNRTHSFGGNTLSITGNNTITITKGTYSSGDYGLAGVTNSTYGSGEMGALIAYTPTNNAFIEEHNYLKTSSLGIDGKSLYTAFGAAQNSLFNFYRDSIGFAAYRSSTGRDSRIAIRPDAISLRSHDSMYSVSTSSLTGFRGLLISEENGNIATVDLALLGFGGYFAGEYINFESYDEDGNTSTTVQTPYELSFEVHSVDSASTGVYITPSEINITADSIRLLVKGGGNVYAPTATTLSNYTVVLSDNNSGGLVVASPALVKRQTSGTPSGTSDTQGTQGDMLYDSSYIYIKTSAGWKRVSLSSF